MIRSFDQDIGAVITRLERRARAAHDTAVALELLAAADFRRETERAQCERWLKPANVKVVHQQHLHARLEGTCNWITSVEEYTKWVNPNCLAIEERLLLISGSPGCGKSILASSIISRLAEDSHQTLFFAFSSSDASQQTIENLIRTILWQSIHKEKDNHNIIDQLRLSLSGEYSVSDLWEAFRSIASSLTKPVFCVIDALDECCDFSDNAAIEVMSILGSCPKLRLMLLGRPHAFEAHSEILACRTFNITPALIDQDIESFIHSQISESRVASRPEIHERVYRELKQKSDGMFLYVKLMADELKKPSSIVEVEERLQTLPRGLENAYNIVFLHLSQGLDKSELRQAQTVLTFITISCRPLHINELRFACALQSKILRASKRPLKDFLCPGIPQSILRLLCSLVSMSDGFLRFTHSSVRDFLLRPAEQWNRDLDQRLLDFKVDLTTAHQQLSWLCLDFLEMEKEEVATTTSDTFDSLPILQNNYPFLEYATLYTFYHLNRSGTLRTPTLARIENMLSSAQVVTWIKNFIRLQFEDLNLCSHVTEVVDFVNQITDAGLDVQYLAIFDQTLQAMRSSGHDATKYDDPCAEQIAVYVELANEGQFGPLEEDSADAAKGSFGEPGSHNHGAPSPSRNSGSLPMDSEVLLARIRDLLKDQTFSAIPHQIEVSARLALLLLKTKVLVDPLRLVFQIILQKSANIPVYALAAVGLYYQRFGKFNEALEVFLAASRKLDHLNVPLKFIIHFRMGQCYDNLFQRPKAFKEFETAFNGLEDVLGTNHSWTLLCLYDLIRIGISHFLSDREVLRLCEKLGHAQDLSEKCLRQNMSLQRWKQDCYSRVGEVDQAVRMKICLQESLKKYLALLKGDDDKRPFIAHGIGLAHYSIGDHEAALMWYKRAFEGWKSLKGADHQDTMIAQNNLADTYHTLKCYSQAMELDQDLYAKYLRLLGPNHELTREIEGYLAEHVVEDESAPRNEPKIELGLKSHEELEYEEYGNISPIHPMPIDSRRFRGPSRSNLSLHSPKLEEWLGELTVCGHASSEPGLLQL